jgi:hypothetical protein
MDRTRGVDDITLATDSGDPTGLFHFGLLLDYNQVASDFIPKPSLADQANSEAQFK